jgi:Sec-independent protein translocase protein TatA
MSLGELLVTCCVALIVIKPQKLPRLISQLGRSWAKLQQQQQSLRKVWQQHLNELQLEENTERAKKADQMYQQE